MCRTRIRVFRLPGAVLGQSARAAEITLANGGSLARFAPRLFFFRTMKHLLTLLYATPARLAIACNSRDPVQLTQLAHKVLNPLTPTISCQ